MKKQNLRRNYVRQWREKRGLSLRELANRLEAEPGGAPVLSHASIGRIEKGEQAATLNHLQALADALQVSLAMLIDMDPTKEGEVIDLMRHFDEQKRSAAIEYLRFLSGAKS